MGLTRVRAYQVFDIDYKQAVRVVTRTNINLSGGAPSVVDGVSLSASSRVLVSGQTNSAQNGIYTVSTLGSGGNGVWVRAIDANQTGEIQAGMIIMVTEGNQYADTQWKLVTNDPIVVDETELEFVLNNDTDTGFLGIVANGTSINSATSTTLTLDAGNNIVLVGNASTNTVSFGISSSPSFSGNISATNILPIANATYDLGSPTQQWKSLYVSGNTIYIGGGTISANSTGITITSAAGANFSVSGNSSANTVGTFGILDVTGNITGGNLITTGIVSSTGVQVAGDVSINGNLQVTGNIVYVDVSELKVQDPIIEIGTGENGGALLSNDGFSRGIKMDYYDTSAKFGFMGLAASDYTTFQFLVNASETANTFSGTGANLAFGNAVVSGLVSVTGNVTGSNLLTGGLISASGNIYGGNVSGINISGTLATAAQTNITSVGTLTSLSVSGNVDSGNLRTSGSVSATGNITGNYIIGNASQLTGLPVASSIINGTSNVAVISNGNVRVNVSGTSNVAVFHSNGLRVANTVSALNIDSSNADLAEKYLADDNYSIGTVLVIGGTHEVTQSTRLNQPSVAGTVSEAPAVIMNRDLQGQHVVTIALLGRVPCKVVGNINKGDILTTSDLPGVATKLTAYVPGSIVGKALENYNSATPGIIEILVGRL